MPHLASSCLFLSLLLRCLCQAGVCQWKPFWIPVGESFKEAFLEEWVFTSDDSSDEQRVTDFLCSYTALATLITYVMIILQHPDHRDSPVLFPGNLRGLKIRPTFWNELRHRCLLYGPDATSFIQDSSVPSCPFQVMKSGQTTKILSPQEQIHLLRGSRWTLTRSWYIIWLMFKKLLQTLARHLKGGLLHLFKETVPANISTRSLVQKRLSIYNWNPWP